MMRALLLRGMLAGLIAGLFVFGFARWAGEPHVDRAIAFETGLDQMKMDQAKVDQAKVDQAKVDQARSEPPEPELVSRKVQKGLGLLTGAMVYSTALGGIFALVFAFARGRLSHARPRVLSALLAAMGFVAIVLIPSLKYPANPPSVGNPETIGIRTAAYFLLILVSVVVMCLGLTARNALRKPMGSWNATIVGTLLYVAIVSVGAHFLPHIDEVPPGFPASLLWSFRIAATETQVVLWTALGLCFGWLTERAEGTSASHASLPPVEELRYS